MNRITDIHDCFGCGVCATACAHNVIGIQLNRNGFYEPYIATPDRCTDCGLCAEVCAYSHPDLAKNSSVIASYAGWSNDSEVRRRSTSGGVAFELCKYLLDQEYEVCAVRYNSELGRAEHYIAKTIEELAPSKGSKYIQSYTLDGFSTIDKSAKYLVVGTPCQIDSFRRFIQKFRCEENFILLDFFCHGVPSMLAWQKYLIWAKQKTGKIQSVTWRDKSRGWRNSYIMNIKGDKGSLISSRGQGDMFLNLFLSDCCLGPQCHKDCKYKCDQSAADIRIGDFWGREYKSNTEGINSVLCFSQKGQDLLKSINCTIVEHPFEIVVEGQLKNNPEVAHFSKSVWQSLHSANEPIEKAARYSLKQLKVHQWKGRINHILQILHIS